MGQRSLYPSFVDDLFEYSALTPFVMGEPVEVQDLCLALDPPDSLDLLDPVIKGSGPDKASDGQWSGYLSEIFHCHKCPGISQIRKAVVSELKDYLRPDLDVLFVSDFFKGEDCERPETCFTGQKQLMLQNMIQAMGLQPSKVAITLMVKCAVELNLEHLDHQDNKAGQSIRSEGFDELVTNCKEHLHFEIVTLKPRVVIALGSQVCSSLRGTMEKLSKIHGQFFDQTIQSHNKDHSFKLVPLFHPDFLLVNPNMKRTAWNDLKKVMSFLEGKSPVCKK